MTPNDQPKVSDGPKARNIGFQLAAVGLVVVSGLAGLGLCQYFRTPTTNTSVVAAVPDELKLPKQLFVGWNKPDFVLLLSGEQHGYLMPCGCSHPQKGGLERRFNFKNLLEAQGWTVIAADLGDVPQTQGPAGLPNIQAKIKYRYSMDAMKHMGYAGVSFGKFEASLKLDDVLAEWALNDKEPPLLAANFTEKVPAFKDFIHSVAIKQAAGVNVAVGGIIGPMIGEDIEKKDAAFSFTPGPKAIPELLKEMAAKKADLRVLLYQGDTVHGMKGKKSEVYELIDAFPQFNVILCLDEGDEPSSEPDVYSRGRNTMIVKVGYKGRHVGVVGVWKTGNPKKPFTLKYQLVELGEEYITPKTKAAANDMVALMQKYKQELKDRNYLGKYQQSLHPNEIASGVALQYMGSGKCQGCHSDVYAKWAKTKHSGAYQTLVVQKNPNLNEFDPECIVCHTVGFGVKTGFQDMAKTPKLINVGCESCHGPGSEHWEAEQLLKAGKPAPNAGKWRELMNPWRTPDTPEAPAARKARLLRIDTMCQSCHDKDNDVNWIHDNTQVIPDPFERKWLEVWHYQDRDGYKNRDKLIEEFTDREKEKHRKEKEKEQEKKEKDKAR